MAGSVNKVILIGNLGADPVIKVFDDSNKLARISVATSESYKNRMGETVENTEWHNVILRGGLAGVAEQYLKKGDKVYIEGQIRTRKWTDNEGKDQYSTEVVAREMTMLGGAPKSAQSGSAYSAPDASQNPQAAASPSPSAPIEPNHSEMDNGHDDLPF